MANKIKQRVHKESSVDLTSFMNLMVVLIPILLASAEFAKIATIDIDLPKDRGTGGGCGGHVEKVEEPEKMVLTVLISDSAMTIGTRSGFIPSIWYKEYHKYNGLDSLVEYNPESIEDENPNASLSIHDREDIFLIAMTDETLTQSQTGWYSSKGELLTDVSGAPVNSIIEGERYYALASRESFAMSKLTEKDSEDASEMILELATRRVIENTVASNYEQRPLSAYDLLKSNFVQIRERYTDVEDRDDLIIAAEDQIAYDKIIQLMDIGRSSNLSNISIAKLRRS